MIILRRESGEELILDAAISESWQPEVIITDHPVESGSPVSDHAQRQPERVSLQVMTSETPLGRPGPTGPERVRETLRFLNEAGGAGELLELETRYGETDNWLLESWPHDVGKIRGLAFSITLKQVRIAQVETIMLPSREVADTMPAAVDVGEQPTQAVDGTKADQQRKSLAAMGFDKAAAGFSHLASGLVS